MKYIENMIIESQEKSDIEKCKEALLNFLFTFLPSWCDNLIPIKIENEFYYIENVKEISNILINTIMYENPEIINSSGLNNDYISNKLLESFGEKVSKSDKVSSINIMLEIYKELKFINKENHKIKKFINVYKYANFFYKKIVYFKDIFKCHGFNLDLKNFKFLKTYEAILLDQINNPKKLEEIFFEYKKCDSLEKKYNLIKANINVIMPCLKEPEHNNISNEINNELNKYFKTKEIAKIFNFIYRHNINDTGCSNKETISTFNKENDDKKNVIMDIHMIIFIAIFAIISKLPGGNEIIFNLIENKEIKPKNEN